MLLQKLITLKIENTEARLSLLINCLLLIVNVSSILPIYIRRTKCLYYEVLWASSRLPQDIYWIHVVLDNFPLQRATNDHSILLLIYIDSLAEC